MNIRFHGKKVAASNYSQYCSFLNPETTVAFRDKDLLWLTKLMKARKILSQYPNLFDEALPIMRPDLEKWVSDNTIYITA